MPITHLLFIDKKYMGLYEHGTYFELRKIVTFKDIFWLYGAVTHFFQKVSLTLISSLFLMFLTYPAIRKNKAIAMMRRKSPRSENIYLIENHCQANISK